MSYCTLILGNGHRQILEVQPRQDGRVKVVLPKSRKFLSAIPVGSSLPTRIYGHRSAGVEFREIRHNVFSATVEIPAGKLTIAWKLNKCGTQWCPVTKFRWNDPVVKPAPVTADDLGFGR